VHLQFFNVRKPLEGVVVLPYGMGLWGWFIMPYPYWGWSRCRWFPWLPRWWWTGIYGSITPFTAWYGQPWLSREEEVRFLEEQKKLLEEQLNWLRKRVEELKTQK